MSKSDNTAETNTAGDDASSLYAGGSQVTMWLRKLESGDAKSASDLYQHFCSRLQLLVKGQIPTHVRATYDQDDVAVSAFHSLFLGIRERRYQFGNREDFWRLLMVIAERKIAKRIRYETRDKRDVRRRMANSVFLRLSPDQQDDENAGVKSLPGYEPSPEFATEVAETCENLLASLPDDSCRKIALLMLENYTAEQVAKKLGCSRRTVQRKLLVIRRTWQDAGGIEISREKMSQLDDERALDGE